MESSSGGHNLPKIQVFRPTMDEFKDFSRFIEFIELQGAHKAGLAKVIPPKEWIPRKSGYDNLDLMIPAPILQSVSGNKGLYTTYNIQQKPMHLKDFEKLANDDRHRPPRHSDFDELERKFWKNVTFNPPIYGADISGSLYDKEQTIWNINRLGTILDHVSSDYSVTIEGVNTAYLYFGMWKTSFCWHTEDMDLYSINYLHFGAPKSWYAIPPEHGRRLERLAAGFFPNEMKMCPAFLRHKTTHISPHVLRRYSIPFNRITQEVGEFMITFPYSYHAGFNHGYNCAESTNFASVRWIEYGKRCLQCVCKNDMVHISMDCFIEKYQPDRYELWKEGRDYGAHPEDDQSKLYSSNASTRSASLASSQLSNQMIIGLPGVSEGARSHRVSRRHPVIAQVLPEKEAELRIDEPVPALALKAETQDTLSDENLKIARICTITRAEEPLKRKSSCDVKNEKRVKRKQNFDADDVIGKAVAMESAERLKDGDHVSLTVPTINCPERTWNARDGASKMTPDLISSDHSYTSAGLCKILNKNDVTSSSYCSATLTTSDVSNCHPIATLSLPTSEAAVSQIVSMAVEKCNDKTDSENFSQFSDPKSRFPHAVSFQTVGLGDGVLSVASSCSDISGPFDLEPSLPELKDEDLLLINEDLLGEEIVEVFDDATRKDVDEALEVHQKQLSATFSGFQQKDVGTFSKLDGKPDRHHKNRNRSSAAMDSVVANIQKMCPQLSHVAALLQVLPENSAAEVEFNRRASQVEPFCSVCSLLTHNSHKVNESNSHTENFKHSLNFLPVASKPLIHESLFGLCEKNSVPSSYKNNTCQDSVVGSSSRFNNLIGPVMANGSSEESVLFVCNRCRVCVHASCYGETTASSKSSVDWTCDRCLYGTFADACCMCLLRGGALKQTNTGRWAHIVCALAIDEAGFQDVVSRGPITTEDVEPARKKLRCAYCHILTSGQLQLTAGQLFTTGHGGACVQCAAEGCFTAFHVTCAKTVGLKFLVIRNAQGRQHISVRCEKHVDEKPDTIDTVRPVPSICRGEHVIAKHKNRRYYRCLVTGVQRQLFFRVAFGDGSYSNDTFPADIEWPRCSADAPPTVDSAVKVRWSDGLLYDAVFKGTNDVCLYQVQFEDGSVLNLERKDIWSESEELPKKVISRMSVATETKHNLFQDEKKELSSRTRSVKLCYIRDQNFVDP